MILKTFVTGMLENNNYLLIDEESKEAVLIDCSAYIPDVSEILKSHNAGLKYILITHAHFDHVMGIDEFHKNFPSALICVPEADRELLEDIDTFVTRFIGNMPKINVPHVDKYIYENDILNIGGAEIRVIPSSGHTKGGVCYFIDNKLFSGDTIFLGSVGRTDLPGGSYEQIKNSVKKVLDMFEDEIPIYCGHGESTTVGYEKVHNPVI